MFRALNVFRSIHHLSRMARLGIRIEAPGVYEKFNRKQAIMCEGFVSQGHEVTTAKALFSKISLTDVLVLKNSGTVRASGLNIHKPDLSDLIGKWDQFRNVLVSSSLLFLRFQ